MSEIDVETDAETLELINQVTKQKSEIEKTEKYSWSTNCSFSYDDGKTASPINLRVVSEVRDLVNIAAFLFMKKSFYNQAVMGMGVTAPEFEWQKFSFEQWTSDIKARINQVQITTKKQQLDVLETRLNAIVSPKLRAKLEREAIMKELGSICA